MNRLYLDIETIPAGEDKYPELKKIFEKSAEKKGLEKNTEDFEQYLLKTSFDGAFGRILCIGYAVNDDPTEVFYSENEKEILRDFWEKVRSLSVKPTNYNYPDYGLKFIGHNVMDFDLRFIYQRSIVHNVKPAYDLNFARYRNYPIYDTMKEWVRWANSSIGLETIALALGVPTPKDGIDGSQVYDFYQSGKINDILEYCKRDVEATRKIHKRMEFLA